MRVLNLTTFSLATIGVGVIAAVAVAASPITLQLRDSMCDVCIQRYEVCVEVCISFLGLAVHYILLDIHLVTLYYIFDAHALTYRSTRENKKASSHKQD
jgi:hypothetical protein